MKLRRSLLIALLPLTLLLAVLVPATIATPIALAQSGTYVFDWQNILTQDEFNELETTAEQYADEYQTGVYLLITDNLGSNQGSASGRNEFGRDYMENHQLGVGSNRNGIILCVATEGRKYVTVKHYLDSSEDPFSNDSVDYMEEEVVDHLSDNEWYEAAEEYYDIIGDHLEYFARNGKQWTEPHVMGSIIKIAATLLIPLFIALGIVSSEKKAMQTANMQTEASNYLNHDSFELRVKTDRFVNRTMTVTAIPKDDDKDSGGGWSSMGGGYSGSGGGSF